MKEGHQALSTEEELAPPQDPRTGFNRPEITPKVITFHKITEEELQAIIKEAVDNWYQIQHSTIEVSYDNEKDKVLLTGMYTFMKEEFPQYPSNQVFE